MDDYLNYRASYYDSVQANILDRYKNINNPDGNSPIASPGATYVDASTFYPDQEDLDHDNTMNELEQYFEYTDKSYSHPNVGQNYITDVRSFPGSMGENESLVSVPGSDHCLYFECWEYARLQIHPFYQDVSVGIYVIPWFVVLRNSSLSVIPGAILIMNWIRQVSIFHYL